MIVPVRVVSQEKPRELSSTAVGTARDVGGMVRVDSRLPEL
jgi:hypothetical protein